MKLDRAQIDSNVKTVEQAIVYLSLVLDEGEVNQTVKKDKSYVEELNKFKLTSDSSSFGIWHRIEEFRDIPFKPIGTLHSSGYEVSPVNSIPTIPSPLGSIFCINTQITPREETVLNLTIEIDMVGVEVILETNSPYVWDRFDFSKITTLGISNLSLNENRSKIMFTTTGIICQIRLTSFDTTDIQNFNFPILLTLPAGRTKRGKDLLIISMTNEFPTEYRPDLTRFNIGGREWTLDKNFEYECYQLQSTCASFNEFTRLSTLEYQEKLKLALEQTIGQDVKLLVSWFQNPSRMYSRAGYENIKSIQYLFTDAI